jgi:uncharacterized SAM-binding protein YcdF (DUF218 family)
MGFFVWSKIFWAVFSPDNLLVWLFVIGAGLTFVGGSRVQSRVRLFGVGLLRAAAIVLVLFALLPLGEWTERPLENRFPRPNNLTPVDGVLVLGGGENTVLFATRGAAGAFQQEGKLIATAELARLYPQAKIVFSGGAGLLFRDRVSEADVARAVFTQMGVDTSRMRFENQSRNTWENLAFSKVLAKPAANETWLLVTPALHMPRTMGIANKVGWKMLPWPTDYLTGPSGSGWPPYDVFDNIEQFAGAMHEWVGLAAYRLTGKIDRLMPAPGDPVSTDD